MVSQDERLPEIFTTVVIPFSSMILRAVLQTKSDIAQNLRITEQGASDLQGHFTMMQKTYGYTHRSHTLVVHY